MSGAHIINANIVVNHVHLIVGSHNCDCEYYLINCAALVVRYDSFSENNNEYLQ